jgi:biotin transport system substrate-specific component
MASTPTTTTMASFALPQNPALRLATQVGLAVVGTLILTIAAKTKVPLGLVDMNLGTLAVMAIGVAFGWRLAVATLLLYLAEGAAGLPVFQGTPEKGIGIAYMLGSTGGYLLGYVVLAAIAGWAADRGWDRNVAKLVGALLVGEVIMMALGFGWLATLIGAEKAWLFGVQPFILVDLLKIALVAAVAPAVWSLIDSLRARV